MLSVLEERGGHRGGRVSQADGQEAQQLLGYHLLSPVLSSVWGLCSE